MKVSSNGSTSETAEAEVDFDPIESAENHRRKEAESERAHARWVLDRDEREDLLLQIRYWREMYGVLFRIINAQHDDPSLAWLDEIVHTRFSKLL